MSKSRRKTALMGDLLERVREQFQRVTIGDDRPANTYTARDCLMCGLAIFVLKFPSMLKFDDARDEPVLCGNLRRLFGVARAPTDSTLRRRLDAIDPKAVHRVLRILFGRLLRHRHLEPFRTADGALPLAVDGTGYYTSTNVHCNRCLNQKTRGGEIRYRHAILGAVVVHPDVDQVVPAAVEPIMKIDGASKQDCEQNAFKRLLPRLMKERQGCRFVVLADALYANAPTVKRLREHGQDFILTVKDGSHAHALEQLHDISFQDDPDDPLCSYRWLEQAQLNEEHGEACLVTLVEQDTWDRHGKHARWSWATNRPVGTVADARAIAQLGRSRWRIENNVFKTLKAEDGYHFEHNYGHGEHHLCTIMMLLMFLAFTIDQVNAMACAFFQAARERQRAAYSLWESQRAIILFIACASWDEFYNRLAGVPPDI